MNRERINKDKERGGNKKTIEIPRRGREEMLEQLTAILGTGRGTISEGK